MREFLNEAPHDYRASTNPFLNFEIEKVKKEMRLVERGRERGNRGEPPTGSKPLDEVEQEIVRRIYPKVPVFENFRKTEYYRKVRADLTGVRCEILYVRRETKRHIQGAAHINFWQLYFADQNGEITRVRMVEG